MENIQEILVYITVLIAVGFLVKKYFFKNKKTTKSCGEDDCGGH